MIKLGAGYRYYFDYDRCTGCRACFEQCPVHSIEMFPEEAPTPPEAFVAGPNAVREPGPDAVREPGWM